MRNWDDTAQVAPAGARPTRPATAQAYRASREAHCGAGWLRLGHRAAGQFAEVVGTTPARYRATFRGNPSGLGYGHRRGWSASAYGERRRVRPSNLWIVPMKPECIMTRSPAIPATPRAESARRDDTARRTNP